MKNEKVILINGTNQGGSNILWNLLQSHPSVCHPFRETGESILQLFNWLPRKLVLLFLYEAKIYNRPLGAKLANALDKEFYKMKLKNFGDPDNGTKYDGVDYTEDEVKKSVLCIKSLNYELYFNEIFMKYYKDLYFIGIIRNGYAFCNSWTRRNRTAFDAGLMYKFVGERMLEFQKNVEKYKIVKFEDILNDPFGMAEDLYKFCDLEPTSIEKLRLKSKRVLSKDGHHGVLKGEVNRKYWFDRDNISEIIKADIDKIQADQLSRGDREAFEQKVMSRLKHFGYVER